MAQPQSHNTLQWRAEHAGPRFIRNSRCVTRSLCGGSLPCDLGHMLRTIANIKMQSAPSTSGRSICSRHSSRVGLRRAVACSAAVAAPPTLKFSKYQGLGNDFILVDNRHSSEPVITPQQAVAICNRNFGIGGDGVIFALPPVGETDLTMRIYNSDGSEPEMCGNGIRCLARFVADLDKAAPRKYKIHTLAGLIVPELLPDGQVKVDMGQPILDGPKVPTTLAPTKGNTVVQREHVVGGHKISFTCVSMGNPHAVTYSIDDKPIKVDDLDLKGLGPQCENNAVFPARTNTEFVEILSRSHVRMVVWERGAGPTLACGTGACATVVAGVLEGRVDRQCRVDLPGGPLYIEWRESDNKIYMTGPAELVFSGDVRV